MAKRKDSKPDYCSPEWNDYVMSHFQDNELIDGNPLTAGLRRVSELLIGVIVDSKPTQIFPVQGDGVGRATVAYEVTFKTDEGNKTYDRVV